MSSFNSPIILSPINLARNALCLSPSSSSDVLAVYASGLTINVLDALSLSLYQSINLIHYLPHLSASRYSIHALCLSHRNRKLIASCGNLTVILEQSTSNSFSSWKLHSTFSSHISNIASIQLKEPYCLVAGQDGISVHQLQEDTINSDYPPRWIKRWMHRGQPFDQAVFEILNDGTCLIATSVTDSSILDLYELHLSGSSKDFQSSQHQLCFSLPIKSIHFSQQHFPLNPSLWPLSLMIELHNPVLGSAVHFYNLMKQPIPSESYNEHRDSRRSKLKVRYVHNATCAISIPLNSPRIVAAFPLDNFDETFISQNQQPTGSRPWITLIVTSNGEVNLAQSSKNTRLLSSTPFILPETIRDLLQIPSTMIQISVAMSSTSSKPEQMRCLMIVRPLTPTGEIFVTEIQLMDLLAPPVAANLLCRLLPVRRIPYGFRPLFTAISFGSHEQVPFAGLLVTGNIKDEETKHVCLVEEGYSPKSRLLAYAAVTETDSLVGEVQAAGCFQNHNYSSQCRDLNSTMAVLQSTLPSSSHLGSAGVFVQYLDHKISILVQTLSIKRIRLAGFIASERPATLIMNLSNSAPSNSVKGNSALCLTSLNRLSCWSLPDDLDFLDRESLTHSPHEISLPALPSTITLTPSRSSEPVILGLDANNQITRATLPENYNDPKLQSIETSKTPTHPIGTKGTLSLPDTRCQILQFESHNSRFIAFLWVLQDAAHCRTYRIVVLDLKQQPYSAGIVGLDDFEIDNGNCDDVLHRPQLRWSDYHSSNLLDHCFLAVCCGNSVLRVYTRLTDGWWKKTLDLHSKSHGSPLQMIRFYSTKPPDIP